MVEFVAELGAARGIRGSGSINVGTSTGNILGQDPSFKKSIGERTLSAKKRSRGLGDKMGKRVCVKGPG